MAAGEAGNKATRKTNDVGPTGLTVAMNVARLRQQRRLSTYRLAEILEEMGRPIAPSAISRIESGSRKVDVDDLFVLAAALHVSPAALLLLPVGEPHTTFTITGRDQAVPSEDAWGWVLAERPLDLPEGDDGEAWNDFQTHSRPPGWRRYASATPPAEAAVGDWFMNSRGRVVRRATQNKPDPDVSAAVPVAADLLERLARYRARNSQGQPDAE